MYVEPWKTVVDFGEIKSILCFFVLHLLWYLYVKQSSELHLEDRNMSKHRVCLYLAAIDGEYFANIDDFSNKFWAIVVVYDKL